MRMLSKPRVAALASMTTAMCVLGIAGASPASAELSWSYDTSNDSGAGGGVNGWTEIRNYNSTGTGYRLYYRAEFHSRGETLELLDNITDGSKAYAVVKVYNLKRELVDTDTFSTGTSDSYNLGTPDGTGDIPEGYKVTIALSGGGYTGYTITCYA